MTTTLATPRSKAQERFRGRFEAWNAQIQIMLGEVPARWRNSRALRHLRDHHRAVEDRIHAATGGTREAKELEREWAQLKYAWLRAIEAVQLGR